MGLHSHVNKNGNLTKKILFLYTNLSFQTTSVHRGLSCDLWVLVPTTSATTNVKKSQDPNLRPAINRTQNFPQFKKITKVIIAFFFYYFLDFSEIVYKTSLEEAKKYFARYSQKIINNWKNRNKSLKKVVRVIYQFFSKDV